LVGAIFDFFGSDLFYFIILVLALFESDFITPDFFGSDVFSSNRFWF